jgi:hypothetical protein
MAGQEVETEPWLYNRRRPLMTSLFEENGPLQHKLLRPEKKPASKENPTKQDMATQDLLPAPNY